MNRSLLIYIRANDDVDLEKELGLLKWHQHDPRNRAIFSRLPKYQVKLVYAR